MYSGITFRDEYSMLLRFFNWVMQESFEGNDLTGSDVQGKAVSLGLAKYEPYDPKKHGISTHCVEGDSWVKLNVERYGV